RIKLSIVKSLILFCSISIDVFARLLHHFKELYRYAPLGVEYLFR
ncbi:MAG: hypothetical protein ACI80P_000571, partial [Flavobacteriales bacterium]